MFLLVLNVFRCDWFLILFLLCFGVCWFFCEGGGRLFVFPIIVWLCMCCVFVILHVFSVSVSCYFFEVFCLIVFFIVFESGFLTFD